MTRSFRYGGRSIGASSPWIGQMRTMETAFAGMLGKGRRTVTLTFAIGGTATVNVPLDRTFTGDFVVLGGISKQTVGTLGLGTLQVREARRSSDNSADVILVSSQLLSSVTVEVVAVGIGL